MSGLLSGIKFVPREESSGSSDSSSDSNGSRGLLPGHRPMQQVPYSERRRHRLVIAALCAFIGLLSFKPSEPYLSEYLICNYDTALDKCDDASSQSGCGGNCLWSNGACGVLPCANVSTASCGLSAEYNYCYVNSGACVDRRCYKHFSEEVVDDDIYTWSTYFYLPFLLVLGPLAEIVSYRLAITLGIAGRVGTRILLIYGTTLAEMQLTQALHSMGTAAEDILSAYIYHALPSPLFQYATSLVKASALLSSLLSGVLGDILVVEFGAPLTTLQAISAVSVICGAVVGIVTIGPSAADHRGSPYKGVQGREELPAARHGDGSAEGVELAAVQSALHGGGLTEDVVAAAGVGASAPRGAALLRLQLRRLLHAFAVSARLRALTYTWIVGNSVYTIIYNYEVTIYLDLQLADGATTASDSWNGSILSVMLLAGSLGALLPSLMKVQELDEDRQMNLICIFLVVCCLWLLLFSAVWMVWPSLVCLTLFFFFWQFVNVVYYTRLGLAMCSQQNGGGEPPYSIAVVAVVAASVAVQIVLQGVLLSWLHVEMRDLSLVLTMLFCAAVLLFLAHIWANFFSSCI